MINFVKVLQVVILHLENWWPTGGQRVVKPAILQDGYVVFRLHDKDNKHLFDLRSFVRWTMN